MNAVLDAFRFIAKKPWILLPALALACISLLASSVFYEYFMYAAFEQIVIEGVPAVQFWQLPLVLLHRNALNAVLLLALSFIGVFLSVIFAFFYSRHSLSLREGIGTLKEDFLLAVKKWKECFSLGVFLFCTAFIFLFASYLALVLFAGIPLLAVLAIAVLALALLYVLFSVFLFAVPVLAVEELAAKDALKRAWNFTAEHFLGAIAMLAVVLFLDLVLFTVQGLLLEMPEVDAEDWLYAIVLVFFNALVFAFTALALALYYIENRGAAKKPEKKRKSRGKRK